jgi:hypothetical protein
MYESKIHRPLTRKQFIIRMANHLAAAMLLLILSIILGMAGYICFEKLSWIDAFLNSSMLLGGMGPVNTPVTLWGKLFAGFYALYSGLFFIVTAAIIFTPVMHRLLHRFHWD